MALPLLARHLCSFGTLVEDLAPGGWASRRQVAEGAIFFLRARHSVASLVGLPTSTGLAAPLGVAEAHIGAA